MSATPPIPPLLVALCDDAAMFPPGNLPLDAAVAAHLEHRQSAHEGIVGPFILTADHLGALAPLVAGLGPGEFDAAVTAPLDRLPAALEHVRAIAQVDLVALEVALTDGTRPDVVVPGLRAGLDAGSGAVADVSVWVEVPRDGRRDEILDRITGTEFGAKFRTGGVRHDLYPDAVELAGAVCAAVRAGVPFKATAGLHHALRNTDPGTGFEQHGFLNLLVATHVARRNGSVRDVVEVLECRDGAEMARRASSLPNSVRNSFRSFGTCSISDPVTELTDLGLLDPTFRRSHA